MPAHGELGTQGRFYSVPTPRRGGATEPAGTAPVCTAKCAVVKSSAARVMTAEVLARSWSCKCISHEIFETRRAVRIARNSASLVILNRRLRRSWKIATAT